MVVWLRAPAATPWGAAPRNRRERRERRGSSRIDRTRSCHRRRRGAAATTALGQRARSSVQPSCSKPPATGRAAARRARAAPAASRAGPAAAAVRRAPPRQRRPGRRRRVSPSAVSASPRPATSARGQLRAERRRQAQLAALARADAGRSGIDAACRLAVVRRDLQRQPPADLRQPAAPAPGRRRRPARRRSPAAPRAATRRVLTGRPAAAPASRAGPRWRRRASRLAPDAARLVALAHRPQHLAEVGADLGVGRATRPLEQVRARPRQVAQAELDPAQAVGDERVAGRAARARAISWRASCSRRPRSASE
jgi:hypothetical protein